MTDLVDVARTDSHITLGVLWHSQAPEVSQGGNNQMTFEYRVRFVRPTTGGNFAEPELDKECMINGKQGFKLVQVKPIVAEGITSAWMLFFERPE